MGQRNEGKTERKGWQEGDDAHLLPLKGIKSSSEETHTHTVGMEATASTFYSDFTTLHRNNTENVFPSEISEVTGIWEYTLTAVLSSVEP